MEKIFKLTTATLFALLLSFQAATPAMADAREHKVVIHVDENDAKRMNLALNNAENLTNYYESKGEKIAIEVVAYGPGLNMFRQDTSPVKTRIAAMSLKLDNISFAACSVTKGKMEAKSGKKIQIISEARMVPSGVVQLMTRQEQGWSYIRP